MQSLFDPSGELVTCAEDGDLLGVRSALAAGADVNSNGGRALVVAAEHGHLKIVKLLLASGVDVNIIDELPLQWAAEYGHIEIVRCLLEAGASASANSSAALQWAAENGHASVVELLITAGADVAARSNLALQVAASGWHTAVARLLLAATRDLDGMRPHIPRYAKEIQLLFVTAPAALGLCATDLARQGVCPDALCVLLERQDRQELAGMLKATQPLARLQPEERAALLAELLTETQAEPAHLGP